MIKASNALGEFLNVAVFLAGMLGDVRFIPRIRHYARGVPNAHVPFELDTPVIARFRRAIQ
jgi:hypothetical protein